MRWSGRYYGSGSNIEPMDKIARLLRVQKGLPFDWFRAKGDISTGAVVGFKNETKRAVRKTYG